MDSCDFLLHQSFQGGGLAANTWADCRSAQTDVSWLNWQKSGELPSLPCYTVAGPLPSHPRGLKRRTPDSFLTRTSSLVSGVDDYSVSQQLLDHTGNGTFCHALPLTSSSYPPVRKIHKGSVSCSNSSTFQAVKNSDLSFTSPAQSFSNEEIVHPCSSPFSSFASPVQSLSNEEVADPGVGSPATSITTEQQYPYRGSTFSSHSFYPEESNNPHSSPFKGLTRNEEIFSIGSDIPSSDGSPSSEVVGSPYEYNDLNNLMEYMLYDLPKVEGCDENHSSYAIQIDASIDGQDHLQQHHPTYVQASLDPAGCVSDSQTHDLKSLLQYKGENNSLLGGICSLQETGLWEYQTNSSTGMEEHAWSQKEVFEPVQKQQINSSICIGDHSWSEKGNLDAVGNSSHLMIPKDTLSRQQISDHSAEGKRLRNPAYNQNLLDKGHSCNASFEPNDFPNDKMGSFCDKSDKVHKLGGPKEKVTDQFGQIKQIEEQTRVLDFQASDLPFSTTASDADYNGIRLVHLLIAAAEAVSSRDMDLAAVILARLKELEFRTGSTMQRVASYFTDGLQCRIEGARALDRFTGNAESYSDILAAFQILHEISPYIKFGHFTANQAILEAIEGEKRVHIVDYEIMEGIQWPSLMQALASRQGGAPHLRITALYRAHAKRGMATVQETGRRLSEFASSLNLPFTFCLVRLDNEEEFRPSLLKVTRGETLVVNCMLHLPHMPHKTSSSVFSFLHGMRKLCPAVVTLVEDELGCTPTAFTSHFFEALHYYSAMFDSLEASLSSQTAARTLVERVFFAPRITSTVTFCGSVSNSEATGTQQEKRSWYSLVSAAGFKPWPLSINNHCQAKLLLGLFRDGFKLDEDNNRLLLGWRGKPLIAASVWSCG